ncbi:MAG: hypothetical protein ACYC8T_34175 [Myxococcaceae bacterium]
MLARRLALFLPFALLAGCGGDNTVLVNSKEPQPASSSPGEAPAANQTASPSTTAACANDCDCGAGTHCAPNGGGELGGTACVPGNNTCLPKTCPAQLTCLSSQSCVNGACVAKPPRVGIAGQWKTTYQLDVHDFASKAGGVLAFLDLLQAIVSGQGSCANQTSAQGQLMCLMVSLVAQNFHAPPWVSQLLTVLSDLFRFGNKPVTATGLMTVTDGYDTVSATESWSTLKVEYQGQQLDLMHSPVLGSAGNVTVTVKPFAGTRDASTVSFGPRQVDLDVNKFIVAILNVAINAATHGQATDVGELIDLVLCGNVPFTSANYAMCVAAASQLGNSLELDSGLGGFDFTNQNAPVIDENNDLVADKLARSTAQGLLKGSMSNGLISGALGPLPSSGWYGVR